MSQQQTLLMYYYLCGLFFKALRTFKPVLQYDLLMSAFFSPKHIFAQSFNNSVLKTVHFLVCRSDQPPCLRLLLFLYSSAPLLQSYPQAICCMLAITSRAPTQSEDKPHVVTYSAMILHSESANFYQNISD